ncbi:partitioning defective 3 homolog [Trichonephila inaurata madagascariensis]|uniref:Partitioning defective 3 homolog n=1 Tax=Trichonephila inaurata madagascariensis TaxID=2747483 RepID=A0A8X6XVQ0_9ARAC|nr:partitioning defective 3 homolog [Trichonephila inaurata madagascariensis]
MKVTVNFGSVRVIVPCGKGDLPVKKLMDLAITRYKKATGKSVDSWVTIHNLKLLSDGGILDPDDKLNDVADDREQITAVFDEEISSYLMHNGGDGTSASSVGTESPDIFQNGDAISIPLSKSSYDESDTEIRDEKLTSGLLPLHVRRGSEPALNRLSPSLLPTIDNCKRWSAAVLASDESYKRLNSEGEEQSEDDLPPGEREDGSGEEKSVSYHQYLDSWNHEIYYRSDQRKEPLGGPITSPKHSADETEDSDCSNSSHTKVEVMKLKNEDGPLGIRIVPADESPDRNNGVIIQGIEPGGRIDRDGRFSVGDRITEINGLKLCKDSYRNAHEILKDAMKAPELSIHCIKKDSLQRKHSKNKQPPAVLPKPLVPLSIEDAKNDKNSDKSEKTKITNNSTLPLSTPIKRLLANALNKGTPGHSSIRKVGRRILVHLTKGSEGLGFSITSKDPNNGPPFFIKNILPAGAAVDDGRLKTGDKLLEVNKIDVSSLTQPEVLSILRKVPYGEMVELVISRQETDLSPSPSLPRQLPPEKCGDEVGVVPWKRRDIFTYEVPLNDTGSAGLGVSVKGKTSNTEKGPLDMGIFLKNIFHGGAAHKDGRLCVNDQLLNVNGISLLGMTNGQAMETLRRAMIQGEGPNVASNAIILTVARRVYSPNLDHPSDQGEGSGHDRSDSLLSESGDSFYVSTENLTFSNKCNGVTPDTSTSDNSANTVIFNASVQKDNIIMEQESSTMLMAQSSEVPTTELINVQNSDTSDLDVNNKQYLQHSMQTRNEINGQTDVSDLIDFHETNSFVSNYEYKDQSRGTGSLLNHNKTFSNLTEMDLYQSDTTEQDKIQTVSDCDNQSSFREQTKRKRFPLDGSNNFKRSGLGRQSMPEKKFVWTYQRNQCLSNERTIHNGTDIHTPHASHELLPCQHYSEHLGVREMPVDVGPIETLTLKQRKHHRTKGSCNSPDCPYHAVPTTTGRESGSSDEISEQVGPSLGLFKSSSLESLQTMLHEKQKQNLPLLVTNGNTSRGCNESFRAAVDKSFEVTDQNENSVINKNNQQDTASLKRHTRAKTVDNVEKKDSKQHKKKGLFRGLGSVFRFGKSSKKASKETNSTSCKQPESVNLQAQNTVNLDQERAQRQSEEHAEQLHNQQLYNHSVNRHTSRLSFTFPRNRSVLQSSSQNGSVLHSLSREERMYALRNEHQKKHRQRNGYYPQEDQEEIYEQRLREIVDTTMINRPLPPLPHQQTNSEEISQRNTELSPKSKNLEIYKEMSKPGSRKGFADPNRYSHYMNFQEIQQHLQQFRLHQNLFPNDRASENLAQYSLFLNESKYMASPNKRHYRHTVSTPRSRPVSELYDFRNTGMGNTSFRGMSESGSLPKKMFYNSRQRPPIPLEFMAQQVNENNYIVNGQLSPSLYNQTTRNSGSKV